MASAPKGLILLDTKSSILHELLQPRILEGKREACEITFMDFDDVHFKLICAQETPNIVSVHVSIKNAEELKKLGAQDVIDRLFPGMEIQPVDGFNVAIQFDCDTLNDPQKFLANISDIRKLMISGPLDRAFNALLSKTSDNLPVSIVEFRQYEPMFIVPSEAKVIVIFAVDFFDVTDKALARVFMQEFVEAQRVVRNAPPVSFSKEPPPLLSKVNYAHKPDIAGFISFAVEERHVTGPGKDKAIALLSGFRNYLHYHIKCSKTYLHMRMRKKVAGWMLVLNRAIPEVETEKKTAAGKTFVRR